LSFLPVIDFGVMAKLAGEYKQMLAQYELLKKTYDNAEQQVKDAEGHYGFGSIKNKAEDLKAREWSPDNWESALHGLSGGNPERYQQLLDQYAAQHHFLSQEEYQKGSSQAQSAQYQQAIATHRASAVQATYAFDDIKQHLETIHTLSSKIEEAENTKAALDLNTRVLTEIAYISVQELKMQALLNQQFAQQSDNQLFSETQAAAFNTLEEKGE